ncbi:MAG: phenylalanine--tRNA ligase subunit beta, partial [Pseudomonadota bacterium]
MHISLDWIGDYVDVPELPPAELARRFTMGTAEVDSFKGENEHLEKILVVQATQIDKHPDADKLSIVHFKVSDKEQRNVVTGATNVVVGKKYPYAPTGTLLPNGLLLRPQKLRGVMSEGMLCSEDELGLGSDHDGIMALPDDAPLGVSLANLWQQKKDILIDIDNKSLTHRPDLWGIYGLAREFAAIFERPLKNPYDEKWAAHWRSQFDQRSSPVVPKLVGESSCWGYFGLTVENITIAESPAWMKKRLQAVGIRAINNIVDISNYVMIELGLPLHIFDRDQIAGNELIIKRVGEECEFVTLDEVKRKLIPSDTVIGDTQGPSVLAGIMGGLKSGVSNQTKRIFIEVANWKAAEVRKTSSRLGLRTDASQRFEKS